MIDLKIQQNGVWSSLELTEDPGFTITKQFSDLQEPTDYFADYSKTVKIIKSQHNNKILKDIFRLDVAQFDARKKIPFMIIVNGAKMVSGVAKMTSIDENFYNMQLSGEMADTFKTLRSLTFSEGSPYTIENPLSTGLILNRFLIQDSWNNIDPQLNLMNCRDVDIIGFCPTIHGLNSGFDSKSMTTTNNGVVQLSTIGSFIDSVKNVTSGDTIVGEGLTERQVGEFRSYYQKPYIYINKLFQIFKRESERRCHYTLKLDRDWFNNSNKFYSRVVYMLPDLLNSKAVESTDNLNLAPFESKYTFPDTGKTDGIDQWNTKTTDQSYDIVAGYDTVFTMNVDFDLRAANSGAITFNKTRLDPDNGMIIEVYAADATSGLIYSKKSILLHNSSTRLNVSEYDEDVAFGYEYNDGVIVDNPAHFKGSVPITLGVRANRAIKLGIRTRFYDTSMPYQGKDLITAGIHYNFWQQGNNYIQVNLNDIVLSTTVSMRSDSPVTMSRLWPEDKTIYDVVLQYCKMFGLIIDVNDETETIDIMSRSKYFKNIELLDWDDKIDKSSMIVKPAMLDERYLQFGYGDTADDTATGYKDKYKVPYGSSTLDTENEFNNDTKTLFESVVPSCIVSERMTTLYNVIAKWLGIGHPIPVFDSTEVFPSNISGNNSADCWGNFYFMSGSQPVDNKLGGCLSSTTQVFISDDDEYQIRNNKYCYTGAGNSALMIDHLPLISTLDASKSYYLTFGTPREQYCSRDYVNSGASDLYKTFHQRWYIERYNAKNKVLSANIYLTYTDLLNFKFNKFVKIANNLYIVNKIVDFDPTKTNVLTSVELLQVDDLNAYSANVFDPYLDVDRKNIKYANNTEYITVYSSSNWTYTPSVDWIRLERSGDRLAVRCTAWEYPIIRSGRITITNDQGLTEVVGVQQRFVGGCEIYVDPNVWIVPAEGDARLFNMSSMNSWKVLSITCLPVDAPQPKTWIYNGRLGVQLSANNTPLSREYTIELKNNCGAKCKLAVYQQGTPISVGGGTLDPSTKEFSTDVIVHSKVSKVNPIVKDYIDTTGNKSKVNIDNIKVSQLVESGGRITVMLDESQIEQIRKIGGANISLVLEGGEVVNIPVNISLNK